MGLLSARWDDLNEMVKTSNDTIYVATNNRKIAHKMYIDLKILMEKLRDWLNSADELRKGRPLEFAENKPQFKEKMRKVDNMISEFSYCFSDGDRQRILKRQSILHGKWSSVIQKAKKEQEAISDKVNYFFMN